MLHFAGFTDVRLQPYEERHLLDYGCGFTAVVDRPTRRAIDVSRDEFRKARPGFEAKMRRYARSIAFLGKRAFSAMIDQPDGEWGRHPTRFAGTTAWVLPNPSGLNRAFALDALVQAYPTCRRPSAPNRRRGSPNQCWPATTPTAITEPARLKLRCSRPI